MVEQTRALRKVGVKAAILSSAAGKVDRTLAGKRGRYVFMQIVVLCTRGYFVQYMEGDHAEQKCSRESCCSCNR